jgi:hypothetical protein
MNSVRAETEEIIRIHSEYAQSYHRNADDLHTLLDKVLDLNDGDHEKVKKSSFYEETLKIAAEKALVLYREERQDNEKKLNGAGVGYDWIVKHLPNEIETKFRGQPTVINELKKMQNSAKQTLKARAMNFTKELDTMLVFHNNIHTSPI